MRSSTYLMSDSSMDGSTLSCRISMIFFTIKIKNELGWYPETTFEVGIEKTINWYLEHEDWMKNVTSGDYQKYYAEMYKNK